MRLGRHGGRRARHPARRLDDRLRQQRVEDARGAAQVHHAVELDADDGLHLAARRVLEDDRAGEVGVVHEARRRHVVVLELGRRDRAEHRALRDERALRREHEGLARAARDARHEDEDGSYLLEVSSPGLNRKLITKEHFDRFIGKTIKIKLKEKIDNRMNYKGELLTRLGNEIEVMVDNIKFTIDIDSIDICRIVPKYK